jgi:hypothetical protein
MFFMQSTTTFLTVFAREMESKNKRDNVSTLQQTTRQQDNTTTRQQDNKTTRQQDNKTTRQQDNRQQDNVTTQQQCNTHGTAPPDLPPLHHHQYSL